ncbi:sterol desaturase family protein [Pontibacter sp. G13]|uniref:sterol desaturase family protein n=1 Tax=Pontibacter sp. G13 TaxID=3074898 RepID=UPI00288BEC36|nr:sterol desaturase family protein [Pontibacter sp. G13]WNJ19284.1 sterol desaturase family protein [Pontibacter sp. G13]
MGGLQYAALIVPVLLLLVFLEYLISKKRGVDAYSFSDTLVNICCGMIERLFDAFWVLMMYFVYGYLYENVALWKLEELIQMTGLPTWLATGILFTVGLFVADLLAYWHHRLSHEINFLWASHIVHHQSEELNLTTVFRVSAFAIFNRAFFFIWMPIFGFSPEITTFGTVFIGLYQFVTHSRLVGKLGIIEHFMVTPSHHRVHHARNEKYIDTNYGHVFIIWDKMFGTFRVEEEEPDYGITTGLESSSPYGAYFFYWKDMFVRARKAKNWGDKFKIFIKPPAWTPEDVGYNPDRYKVDENGNRIKYRNEMPFRLSLYVFLNVMMSLAGFLMVLTAQKSVVADIELWTDQLLTLVSNPTVMAISALVIFSVVSYGFLMDRKPYALKFEFLRIAIHAVVFPILFWNHDWSLAIVGGFEVVMFIFAFWAIRMRDYFVEESVPAKELEHA